MTKTNGTTTDSTDYMDFFENNGLKLIKLITLIIKKNYFEIIIYRKNFSLIIFSKIIIPD